MKPYVICHMVASVDGRILTGWWRLEDRERRRHFEPLDDRLGVDAWLVGRVTGQEYAKRDTYPAHTDQRYPGSPGSPDATPPLTASCSTPTARSPGAVATSAAIRLSSC